MNSFADRVVTYRLWFPTGPASRDKHPATVERDLGVGRAAMAARKASTVSGHSGQRRSTSVFGRGKCSHPLSRSRAFMGSMAQSCVAKPAIDSKVNHRPQLDARLADDASQLIGLEHARPFFSAFSRRCLRRAFLGGLLEFLFQRNWSVNSLSSDLNSMRVTVISLPSATSPCVLAKAARRVAKSEGQGLR